MLVQVVRFARLLRYMGIKVSPGHMLDFLNSLEFVGWQRRDDVKAAGRTTLISRHEDIPLYDEAFDAFWRATDHSEGHEGLVMADDEQLKQQQPRRRLMDAQHRDEEAKEREGEDRRSNKRPRSEPQGRDEFDGERASAVGNGCRADVYLRPNCFRRRTLKPSRWTNWRRRAASCN